MEGGLCNLKQLTIGGVAESILEKLGNIYRVGGLAKLTELYLDNPSLEEDTIRAWLDGVRGSDHGGAALEKPAFQEIIYTERAASYVLIEALSAGAYPNLHSLYAGCIMQGGEVWAAFVHGAPCAGTLREVRVSDPRIWPSQAELCSILPHLELTIEH